MERVEIASLYKATPADGTKVTVCGWAKTVRDSKKIGFISLADGSCYKPVQIVFQADKLENYAEVAKSGLYTSFEVTGTLVLTPNAKQPFEINADTVTVLGTCGSDYPLQKNKMGMDYLRTLTHLRPRTNTFNAAFRVRGQAAYALHEFFHKNGFTYVHTPIFTGSDCEGAGEMFQVTTLDLNDVPKTEDGKVKIGYVGAYNYAEVVSGYTAFFLGVQSVYPNVAMEVMYTNSWFDIDKEGAAAEALIANGSVIIGQHADSTGAPAATQKQKDAGKICYSVGYNIDMLETAPTAALTSATNVWEVYYEYLFKSMMDGENPATNWSEGYNEGAVAITDLGPEVAEGTAEKVAEVEAALKDGSLHVFDTSKFTVNGETVTTAPIDLTFYDYSTGTPVVVYQGDTEEAITDGYFSESTLRSAPYFSLRIDGITEDADPVA